MKKYSFLFVLAFVAFACSKPDTTVGLNKVGVITTETTVTDLNQMFVKDSIVSRLSEGDLGNINAYVLDNDTHLVYEKGGELLLSISPINPLDSVSKIRSVSVFDERFKTEKGVHLGSNFNDLNMNHTIEKLEATFHLVTVFVKDINTTFTMDKQALGIEAFTLGKIDKAQIPNDATFTSMKVWFE